MGVFFCLIERIPSFITSGLNYALLWPVVGRGGREGKGFGRVWREREKEKNIKKKPERQNKMRFLFCYSIKSRNGKKEKKTPPFYFYFILFILYMFVHKEIRLHPLNL